MPGTYQSRSRKSRPERHFATHPDTQTRQESRTPDRAERSSGPRWPAPPPRSVLALEPVRHHRHRAAPRTSSRLTSRTPAPTTEKETTRASGTPPIRRASRAARHGRNLSRPPEADSAHAESQAAKIHERCRLAVDRPRHADKLFALR